MSIDGKIGSYEGCDMGSYMGTYEFMEDLQYRAKKIF